MSISHFAEVDSVAAFGSLGKAGIVMPGRAFAPTAKYIVQSNPHYRMREDMFSVLRYVWAREHVRKEHQPRLGAMIMGPKGSGKTTVVEQFFQRLGVPVPSFTANKRTTVQDIAGGKTLSAGEVMYDEGALVFAMKTGLPFLLNELDLMDPGELTGLNDVIDRGQLVRDNGEVITASRGFIVFATMNTRGAGDVDGSYGGTQAMNKALMRRFLKLYADYPDKDVETEILVQGVPGLQASEAKRFVEVATLIRTAYQGNDPQMPAIEDTLSTAELINWAEMVSVLRHTRQDAPQFAMRLVLTNACEGATAKAVEQFVQRLFPS